MMCYDFVINIAKLLYFELIIIMCSFSKCRLCEAEISVYECDRKFKNDHLRLIIKWNRKLCSECRDSCSESNSASKLKFQAESKESVKCSKTKWYI